MEFFQYISLKDAKKLIDSHVPAGIAGRENVSLPDSLGRIAAEDITAREDMPPFDRSTVDGFAVVSDDTFGASEASPALFSVSGEVIMGHPAEFRLASGQAASIPTGGMLPAGANAVVMVEHTEALDAQHLLVKEMVAPGENVMAQGEDLQAGGVIIKAGERIAPQDIGLLAACGCSRIPVRKSLTVGIISTGDELVDVEMPAAYGQIRDVNSHVLAAMIKEMGCGVKSFGIVKDSYENFLQVLAEGTESCQMVIISGGSSVGIRDYTVKAIDALGDPGVLIHGVAIKPGRPTIFGKVDMLPVFGLPGHPVAAMTVCEQLVKPALRKMLGQEEREPVGIPARLTRNLPSAPGRDDFVPVELIRDEAGFAAVPVLGKSGLIRVAAQADGLVHIPASQSGLYEGDLIQVLLMKNRR